MYCIFIPIEFLFLFGDTLNLFEESAIEMGFII